MSACMRYLEERLERIEHRIQILGSLIRYEDTCQKQVELEAANNKLTDLVAALEQEPLGVNQRQLRSWHVVASLRVSAAFSIAGLRKWNISMFLQLTRMGSFSLHGFV